MENLESKFRRSWDGVLVVDKPAGPTSHDVVDRVRAACGLKRVGHTGTLDPFATGVLAVCIGHATRLVRYISQGSKVYAATVRLGFATSTDDSTGEPLEPAKAVRVSCADVERSCAAMVGETLQTPPQYSAKRINGRRAYERARAGRTVSPKPAIVYIEEIVIECVGNDTVDLLITCSPGTYVRAIARDLGRQLGTGGHLSALRRLRNGEFKIEQAVSWEEIDDETVGRVIPLSCLLSSWPAVVVGEDGLDAIRHGRAITRSMTIDGFPDAAPEAIRVVDINRELIAVAQPRGFDFRAAGLNVTPTLQPVVVLLSGTRGAGT